MHPRLAAIITVGLVVVVLCVGCASADGDPGRSTPTSRRQAVVADSTTSTVSPIALPPTTLSPAAVPPTVVPPTLPPIALARPGPARVVAAGPAGSRGVALTLDDGFCDGCVGQMVQDVARTKAHVTFCPNGLYASVWERYAPFIKVLISRGLVEICNHTLNHKTLTKLSADQIRYEIQANEDWIQQTFGVTSRPYLRPPGGAYNQQVLDVAGQLGFTTVLYWSATLSDSTLQPPGQVIGATERCARPGLIVLGHVNYATTADHFDEILAAISAKGLEPKTVSELLGADPGATGVAPASSGACV